LEITEIVVSAISATSHLCVTPTKQADARHRMTRGIIEQRLFRFARVPRKVALVVGLIFFNGLRGNTQKRRAANIGRNKSAGAASCGDGRHRTLPAVAR
jgi:hypothetical protein